MMLLRHVVFSFLCLVPKLFLTGVLFQSTLLWTTVTSTDDNNMPREVKIHGDRDYGDNTETRDTENNLPNPRRTISSAPSASSTVGCTVVSMTIATDDFPEETSVEILDADTNVLQWSFTMFNQAQHTYHFYTCLEPDRCYVFNLHDSFGNGFCCYAGFGYVILKWDGIEVGHVFSPFADIQSIEFGDSC